MIKTCYLFDIYKFGLISKKEINKPLFPSTDKPLYFIISKHVHSVLSIPNWYYFFLFVPGKFLSMYYNYNFRPNIRKYEALLNQVSVPKFSEGGKSPRFYWEKSKLRSDRETHSQTSDLEVDGRKLFNAARVRDIARVTFITILESIFTTLKI